MKGIIYLFLLILVFTGCNRKFSCDTASVVDKINRFSQNQNQTHLDSALSILSNCPNDNKTIYYRLHIYSVLADYQSALDYLDELDSSLFTFSYKKIYYENYFKSLMIDDVSERTELLNESTELLLTQWELTPDNSEVLMDLLTNIDEYESENRIDEIFEKMINTSLEDTLLLTLKKTILLERKSEVDSTHTVKFLQQISPN